MENPKKIWKEQTIFSAIAIDALWVVAHERSRRGVRGSWR
jgi:hypothetical protein